MSDWNRRPLKLSQLHYSALDAYVLIDLYNIYCDEVQPRVKFIKPNIKMNVWKLNPQKRFGGNYSMEVVKSNLKKRGNLSMFTKNLTLR